MSRSPIPSSRSLNAGRFIGLAAITSALLFSAGCYRHVVGTKNAPGYTGTVYEPNVEEGNETLFQTRTVTPKGSYYVD